MERRQNRSEQRGEAVRLFLEKLRTDEHLDAVTLATDDGLLVAACGALDLERMGALATAAATPSFEWDGRAVHVERFSLAGNPLYLASTPTAVSRPSVNDLLRILSEE